MNIGNMAKGMNDVERFDCSNGDAPYCYGCYRMKRDESGDFVRFEDYEKLQHELAAAREALQAAEANASRYLWLRDVANTAKMNDPIVVIGWYKPERRFIYGEELDAAIDATLQRDRQP